MDSGNNQLDAKNPSAFKPIQELLNKKVTRTEFFGISGVTILSTLGLGSLIEFFSQKSIYPTILHKYRKSGFGSGPYGT
jgi:hypothetical protein